MLELLAWVCAIAAVVVAPLVLTLLGVIEGPADGEDSGCAVGMWALGVLFLLLAAASRVVALVSGL